MGSDHHSEKTESASTTEAIRSDNKGFQMLRGMGWKAGDGLGSSVKGRVEPVAVEQRAERAGLGADNAAPVSVDPRARKRRELWEKTQHRFDKL